MRVSVRSSVRRRYGEVRLATWSRQLTMTWMGVDCPACTRSNPVGAGYFLLLQPLSVGEHRIVVRADVPAVGIAVDAEFIINLEPR